MLKGGAATFFRTPERRLALRRAAAKDEPAGVRARLFWRNLRGACNRPLLAEAVWKHPETSTADNHFIGISRSPMSRFIEGEACSKDLLFPERLDDWIEEGRAAGCGSAAKLRDHAL